MSYTTYPLNQINVIFGHLEILLVRDGIEQQSIDKYIAQYANIY